MDTNKINLCDCKKSLILAKYLKKPSYLNDKEINEFLILLDQNDELKNKEFIDYVTNILKLKNSWEILNLYVYLLSLQETKPTSKDNLNKFLVQFVCNKLLDEFRFGWLNVADNEIMEYLVEHKNNEGFRKEIDVFDEEFYCEYLNMVPIEIEIETNIADDLEEYVLKYHKFITKFVNKGILSKKVLKTITDRLIGETVILNHSEPVGSLVSENLQKLLMYPKLLPKLTIKHPTRTNTLVETILR